MKKVKKKKNTSLTNHGIKDLQFHSCLGKGFQSWPTMVLIKKPKQKRERENENEK